MRTHFASLRFFRLFCRLENWRTPSAGLRPSAKDNCPHNYRADRIGVRFSAGYAHTVTRSPTEQEPGREI